MPPEVEEIKNIVDQMPDSRFSVILHHLEIGMSTFIHDDDFAVQHGLKSEFPQRPGNGRKLSIEGDSVAGIKRNVSA
jgi:hypothetical protein